MKSSYVPPSGSPEAKIAFVGEQPGITEVRLGKPFVGPAGKALNECMQMAKIPRLSVYLTNVIKDLDRPIRHYINIDTRGKYSISKEGYQYIQELSEELKRLKPNIVIALGNIALIALTNRVGITKWRGSILESSIIPGLKVIPTFHPATFIPPKFNFINKPIIIEDLLRAKNESEFPEIRRIARDVKIHPTFNESVNILNHCYEIGCHGQTIDIDIEVINRELDCIAFAWSPTESVSIPFRDSKGDYFNIEQEYEIMLLIAKIIQEEKISKRGANFIFDAQFLFHKYGIVPNGEIHCTQIAQKIAFPDLRAGLDAVTTMHTDIPYYKQDGKQWMNTGVGTWDTWWTYNGMDSIATAASHPSQMDCLRAQGNIETYNRQRKLIKPLIYMSERGIRVDVNAMVEFKKIQEEELSIKTKEFHKEVGYEVNPNSPLQIANYFYEDLGIKPYKNRKTGNTSTDVDALKRLSRRGYKAAQILLDIRGLSKRISTYLDIGKVDKDGRMRSSYKPVGATTGRISSGGTIFGTGCMPPDAEALTRTGWKSLYKLSNNNEEIMQWSPKGELSWCVPDINVYDFKGNMIESHSTIHKGLYTPDHKIPTISKRGILTNYKASEVRNKSNWFLPISGEYTSGLFDLPSVGVLAIIQADGSIEGNGVRFSFSKQRKIDRFLYIMNKYNIEFTEQSDRPGFRRFYITSHSARQYIDILMSSGKKSFGSWIFLLSQKSLKTLLEEIKYWDSYIRNDSFIFYTVDKQNAEWVATLAHLCNKSATITEVVNNKYEESYGDESLIYNVNIKPRNKAYQHEDMYIERYYNWRVYCPTVDTSYFLCRYKGTIFVTGNSNQQNWPHDLLRFFLFDEGYIGYSFDLSLAENRPVAYAGGILEQIRALEEGIDIHRLTASIIFSKPYDEISAEDGSSALGDGKQSERFWGKKANHAINYDTGYKTFALVNEITEVEAKHIIERIHRGYPQIRQGYHQVIQRMLKKNRTVTNLMGRKRLFLGPINPSYPNTSKGACTKTYREAYAHFSQSTVADKINEHGVEYIYYNQDKFAPIELLTQIHDSVVFQIPLAVPWVQHAEMLIDILKSLEQPLYWHEVEIKFPADLAIGFNMCKEQMKEIKSKDFPRDKYKLADKLKEIWNELNSAKL